MSQPGVFPVGIFERDARRIPPIGTRVRVLYDLERPAFAQLTRCKGRLGTVVERVGVGSAGYVMVLYDGDPHPIGTFLNHIEVIESDDDDQQPL